LALEDEDVDSTAFEDGLTQLRAVSMAHNGMEERHEFTRLTASLDQAQRRRLQRRITVVERLAPTRPHPGLELGGENVLGGGFAAITDRVRDLFARDR
jgi:hypothetical protein